MGDAEEGAGLMRARHLTGLLAVAALACSNRSDPEKPRAVEVTAPAAASASAMAADTEEARALREALIRTIEAYPPSERESRWDPGVLDAVRSVPRHLFVPGEPLSVAYRNAAAPIGHGQTISQPLIVAMMTQALALAPAHKVLEIGTGSGYQAAVLSGLCKEVYSIEIVAPLGEEAKARLASLGYKNVTVKIGDGYQGWPEHAPFDRIIVTAAPPEMPKALIEQLQEGGLIVAPLGEIPDQTLVRWKKTPSGIQKEKLADVAFVPMVHGDK